MKKIFNFFWVLLFFAHSFVYAAELPINDRSKVLEEVALKELVEPELFFDTKFEKFVIDTISKEKKLPLNPKECFRHTFDLFRKFVYLEKDKEKFKGFVEYFEKQVLVPVDKECDLFPDKCILELPIDELFTIITKKITKNSSDGRSSFFSSLLFSESSEILSDEQISNYCEFAHIICKNFDYVNRYIKTKCDCEYALRQKALDEFRKSLDQMAEQNKLNQQFSSDINQTESKSTKHSGSRKKQEKDSEKRKRKKRGEDSADEDFEDEERLVYFDDGYGLVPVSYKSYSLISEIFEIYGKKAGCIDSFGSFDNPIDVSSIVGMRLFLILLDSVNSKELSSNFEEIINIVSDGNWSNEEYIKNYWQIAGLVLKYAKTVTFQGQALSDLLIFQILELLDHLGEKKAQDLVLHLLTDNFDLMNQYEELFQEFLPS